MNPIVISSLNTLADTELAISAVHANAEASLRLPKDTISKRKGALHDASRLQMLLTWARSSKDRYLDFHPANEMSAVLKDLCDYAPGIAVLRLANGVRIGEEIVDRRVALRGAASKMIETDAANLREIIKGRSIDMTCVSGMNLQYLRPLFSLREPTAAKDAQGMYTLLRALFTQINQQDRNLVSENFLTACSVFTSELFFNTQEHATEDHKHAPYAAHVEGLIVSWDQMEERLFHSDFQGHERLEEFWHRESTPSNDGTQNVLRCLQLSFFDSGPGFASRATGKPTDLMSPEEERTELLKCLQKNVSTKKQSGAGQGLPGVLIALQEVGGLVRIRSGRHSIFNCFGANKDRDIFDFSDWTNTRLDPVAGALISLIVPLRRMS